MRRLLIGWALLLASLPCVAAQAADSAVIFTYHRFDDDRVPAANTPLEQLDAHIAELRKGGYTVLPLPTIIDALRARQPLPDKSVAITIGDSWKSVWDKAWPRLKAAGFPVTVFVVADEADSGGEFMGWDRLRDLAASGLVTIGSQGAGHVRLALASKEVVAEDLARAKDRFEAELGKVPDLFAWPHGEASRPAIEAVREAGFKAAFGQQSGPAWSGSDPFLMPRYGLNEAYGETERFRLAARSLPLPAVDVTPSDPVLTANPPAFGFTLSEETPGLEHLACYASHEGKVRLERLGPRVEVRMTKPVPQGRGRINCTAPSLDGRWRWFGWQFTAP